MPSSGEGAKAKFEGTDRKAFRRRATHQAGWLWFESIRVDAALRQHVGRGADHDGRILGGREAVGDAADVERAEVGVVLHLRALQHGPADRLPVPRDAQTLDARPPGRVDARQGRSVAQLDERIERAAALPELVSPRAELGNALHAGVAEARAVAQREPHQRSARPGQAGGGDDIESAGESRVLAHEARAPHEASAVLDPHEGRQQVRLEAEAPRELRQSGVDAVHAQHEVHGMTAQHVSDQRGCHHREA